MRTGRPETGGATTQRMKDHTIGRPTLALVRSVNSDSRILIGILVDFRCRVEGEFQFKLSIQYIHSQWVGRKYARMWYSTA